MILLDTNVVSEFMKPQPSQTVEAWASRQGSTTLGVASVTVHEIEFGLRRMPNGVRRQTLQRAWEILLASFGQWVVPLDEGAAHATAEALAGSTTSGRVMSTADAQIAGIALSSGSVLATRNTKDFAGIDELRLLNPFEAMPRGVGTF